MGYNNTETDFAEAHDTTLWDMLLAQFDTSLEVTEEMLDRYDDNVVTPKGFRAQRLRNRRQFDGPHARYARRGYRRYHWDREDHARMVNLATRISIAEMQAEAQTALSPEARAEEEALRRPTYAECVDFYYDTYFNPAALAEHELEEAQRYWAY